MFGPINEEIVMETVGEILDTNNFHLLDDLDHELASAIIVLVDDAIRLFHQKNINAYLKEMDDYFEKSSPPNKKEI